MSDSIRHSCTIAIAPVAGFAFSTDTWLPVTGGSRGEPSFNIHLTSPQTCGSKCPQCEGRAILIQYLIGICTYMLRNQPIWFIDESSIDWSLWASDCAGCSGERRTVWRNCSGAPRPPPPGFVPKWCHLYRHGTVIPPKCPTCPPAKCRSVQPSATRGPLAGKSNRRPAIPARLGGPGAGGRWPISDRLWRT